jgi:hypothetical protein
MSEMVTREIAALLLVLHERTGATSIPRAAVLDEWVRTYPEHAGARSGTRARGGGPGSRAGSWVRQGLVKLDAPVPSGARETSCDSSTAASWRGSPSRPALLHRGAARGL